MGFHICDQLNVARTCCTCASQSIFLPLSSICKAYSRRGKFQRNYIVNTATPSQARRGGTASKLNFIEPKWMLPAEDKERMGVAYQTSRKSVFQVVLTTSKDYGSGISELNAGIIMAFIGERGRCFVQRISTLVSTVTVGSSEQTQDLSVSRPCQYRFERGSQDLVTFCGPDLGKLEAVWVAPEKGTWRIEGMTVTVFPEELHKGKEYTLEGTNLKVLQYDFTFEEFLIGENDNRLAIELKPFKVSEISYDGQLLLGSKSMANRLRAPLGQLRDEGIKAYEALKFSLLGYDALLVTVGSAIAASMGYNEVAEGYLVGGVLGFVYLFVLEKAVDQLPAPASSPLSMSDDEKASVNDGAEIVEGRSVAEAKENAMSLYGKGRSLDGFRGPLTKFSGILAVFLLIAKSLNTANNQALSKQMLLAGAVGFLMTKFATILASNMPIPLKQALPLEKED